MAWSSLSVFFLFTLSRAALLSEMKSRLAWLVAENEAGKNKRVRKTSLILMRQALPPSGCEENPCRQISFHTAELEANNRSHRELWKIF
jgi:hypothetical protein